MKNKKGFTIIEFLITVAIVGLLAAIIVPNIITAARSAKAKAYAEKHNIEYVPPVQAVKQEARSSRITISEVGNADDVKYFIIRDLTNGKEYLVAKYRESYDTASVAITPMESGNNQSDGKW